MDRNITVGRNGTVFKEKDLVLNWILSEKWFFYNRDDWIPRNNYASPYKWSNVRFLIIASNRKYRDIGMIMKSIEPTCKAVIVKEFARVPSNWHSHMNLRTNFWKIKKFPMNCWNSILGNFNALLQRKGVCVGQCWCSRRF